MTSRADINELARVIRHGVNPNRTNAQSMLTKGTVVSVEGTTCTVDIMNSGQHQPDVSWFRDAYTPTPDDSVWMLRNGTDVIILGVLSSA